MLNYWWVTRPKRQLNSAPEILATFAEHSLSKQWEKQRGMHLRMEAELERAGLKRVGERRDQTGGGGRTYLAWLKSLGLIFTQKNTDSLQLTLAGEALLNGENPVAILRNQILKYQFPSPYSLSFQVNVSHRFKIRPFRFLFRLLSDHRIGSLTQEEIAKIVITEAEDESVKCFEKIVNRLLEFRSVGDKCLEKGFAEKYKSGKGSINLARPFAHLLDISNTIINWLNYTQLVERYKDNNKGSIRIFPEKREEVSAFLAADAPFIDRPENEEYFQRKYGLDPAHKKDTRNLTRTRTITPKIIAEQKIRNAFIAESLKRPIGAIDQEAIDAISASTGLASTLVEDLLQKLYPNGAVGGFMTTYFDMAFAGEKRATEFEMATVEIFKKIFKFRAKHIGQQGKTPDALIISDEGNFQAIIDNKAYAEYSIANDHRNRMIHNYIKEISRYGENGRPLAFFSYIAGGFKDTFDSQLKSLCEESGVNGSGINVINMIKLIERHMKKNFTHDEIKNIFSVNRRVALKDIESRG